MQPHATPYTALNRSSSASLAQPEIPSLAPTKAAAEPAADGLQEALSACDLLKSSQSSSSGPAPVMSSGDRTVNDMLHSASALKPYTAAISMYPLGLALSQIQIHAAASAALCGPIREVNPPSPARPGPGSGGKLLLQEICKTGYGMYLVQACPSATCQHPLHRHLEAAVCIAPCRLLATSLPWAFLYQYLGYKYELRYTCPAGDCPSKESTMLPNGLHSLL